LAPHLALDQLVQIAQARRKFVHPQRCCNRSNLLLDDIGPGHQPAEVHLDDGGEAHVDADDVPDLTDLLARAQQAHRRQPEPLLVTIGRVRKERAGGQATHVHHVRRNHRPAHPPVAGKDRLPDDHIAGMEAAAMVRVVDNEYVASSNLVAIALEHRQDGVALHGPVRVMQTAAGDLITVRVEDANRVILGLGDDRADRRTLHRIAGILGNGGEPIAQDLRGDRIDAHCRGSMMQVPKGSILACQAAGNQTVVSAASISNGPAST
jgi:hypothetical protein